MQIQSLLAGVVRRRGAERGATRATEIVKLQTFNRTLSKVSRFLLAYKLYIKMHLRESLAEEQIYIVATTRHKVQ